MNNASCQKSIKSDFEQYCLFKDNLAINLSIFIVSSIAGISNYERVIEL